MLGECFFGKVYDGELRAMLITGEHSEDVLLGADFHGAGEVRKGGALPDGVPVSGIYPGDIGAIFVS